LLEPRARLDIAESSGEPVGICGLRPFAAHEAEIKRMCMCALMCAWGAQTRARSSSSGGV
jgi:hypothetical protein